MKVNGEVVPEEAIEAGVAAMRRQVGFQAYNIYRAIHNALLAAGGPNNSHLAEAAANRLIQRERKRGNVGPLDPHRARTTYWRWIGDKK